FDSVNNKVDCSAASLAYNATDTYTIVVHISPSFANGGTLSNTATLTAEATADPANGNNRPTSNTTVNRSADLQLTKTASPDPGTAGTDETFTVKVKNLGPSDSAGYTVSDPVPTGTSYVSSSAGCSFDSVNNKVDCSAASLAYNATDTYTIVVHISPSFANGGPLRNPATRPAEATADPANGNNSSTSNTTVNRSADLQVTKTASPDPGTAGTDETFTVKVKNLGPSDSAGYTVSDPVPTGTSYVSSSAGCSFDSVNNKVDCSAASLAYNATDTYTIVVHIS